jgi:hypothetical protein
MPPPTPTHPSTHTTTTTCTQTLTYTSHTRPTLRTQQERRLTRVAVPPGDWSTTASAKASGWRQPLKGVCALAPLASRYRPRLRPRWSEPRGSASSRHCACGGPEVGAGRLPLGGARHELVERLRPGQLAGRGGLKAAAAYLLA